MSHYTIPSNASHTSLTDYVSNYDTTISLDTSCKNKLINIDDDADELFMIKNNFYMNYDIEKYSRMINIYNEKINQINFNNFNENIWKKCFELYESRNQDIKKKWFRFPKRCEKIDIELIKNLFIFLNKMHVKNVKTKILKETIELVKNM